MSKLTVCFATLCMLAAPVAATPREPTTQVEKSQRPTRKAASADELAQYAKRERAAEKLAKYEGGRGRAIETGTLIVILLVVIIVILIV